MILRSYKSPYDLEALRSDGLLNKRIMNVEDKLHKAIYELCKHVWNEERLPNEWNKAIVISLITKATRWAAIIMEDYLYSTWRIKLLQDVIRMTGATGREVYRVLLVH